MNYVDPINDKIIVNISNFGLEILKAIKANPGIKVSEIVIKIREKGLLVNTDKVRNELKRKLTNYIEYIGSNKMDGYFLRK